MRCCAIYCIAIQGNRVHAAYLSNQWGAVQYNYLFTQNFFLWNSTGSCKIADLLLDRAILSFRSQKQIVIICEQMSWQKFNSGAPLVRFARAGGAPQLWKFGYLTIREILVVTWPSVHPSTRLTAPHGNQCEISHFLASVGARNLILHIHVVVNWQLSKKSIRWPISLDRIVEVSTHRGCVFFFSLTSY